MPTVLPRLLVIGLGALAVAGAPSSSPVPAYRLLNEIPVGGEGGWDLLSVDPANGRLYVSHSTRVEVIDMEKNRVVGKILDTPGVHDFVAAPDLQRGFSSNGGDSTSSVVDLVTLKTLSKVATGADPDAMLYEEGRKEVYVFNGRGESATVLDAKTGAVIATVPLPGKPELAAGDPAAGLVYCNLEDTNRVAVIDCRTHRVVATWPIAPGEEATGLAIDRVHHRLFVCCHNQLMVMMDGTNGKVITHVPIGKRVDGAAYDPGTRLVFSSNGEGTVTIVHEVTPDSLAVVQTLNTERGSRTLALDPSTHRIYLPAAAFERATASAPEARGPRLEVVPGTFKILVYGFEEFED